MKFFTIGFTKKNSETFFTLLIKNNVKKLIDIRLNNNSQLAGFTKKDDLKYFLKAICNITYEYKPSFAPTKDLLNGYKNKLITWEDYEKQYLDILKEREVSSTLNAEELENACLLCSEQTADKCHRRLAAEYIVSNLPGFELKHI